MAKKNKRKNSKGFIKIFLFLVIVGVLGYFSYVSYNKQRAMILDLNEFSEMFDYSFPREIENDINVNNITSKYYDLDLDISELEIITKEGKVNKPSYTDGDIKVNVTLNYKAKDYNAFDKIINKVLKFTIEDGELYKEVIVKKQDPTDDEKLEIVLGSLYVPKTTYTDIGLDTISPLFTGVLISYTSLNEAIIKATGEIVANGATTLKAMATINDHSKEKEFEITVVEDLILTEVYADFESYENSTYVDIDDYQSLKLFNALSNSGKAKFKMDEEKAYILIDKIEDIDKITFDYQYNEAGTYTKKTFVTLFASSDNVTWNELKKEILQDSDLHHFTCVLSKNDYYLKVLFTTEYSSSSPNAFINVDELNVTRFLNENDIISKLDEAIPDKYYESYNLPKTSYYGGIVSYSSSSESFTNLGVVTINDEETTVDLVVTVNGFDEVITFTKQVKVMGKESKEPLMIYFIDLGKYGDNDCGESILIKYEDIEILIDAGDDYASTEKAIKEAIDSYSVDKTLEYVIATHPDSDHIGSMDYVLETYNVQKIIGFSGSASTIVYQKYKDSVNNENCDYCTAIDSYNNVNNCTRVITINNDISLEIINTNNYEAEEPNARSVVCLLNAYGVRTLFTGDADNLSDKNMEKGYMNSVGNVDILKVVHHGTRNGTTLEYLNVIDPEVAIICNGNYLGNKHGHPTFEAINNLYAYDSEMKVYAITGGDADNCTIKGVSYECEPTDISVNRNGTICIIINNKGYNVVSEYYGFSPIEMKDTDFYKSGIEK